MISANGGLPAHRYTPEVTQRWPRGSELASPLADQQRPKREGAGLIGEKQVRFHDLHLFISVHPEAGPEN